MKSRVMLFSFLVVLAASCVLADSCVGTSSVAATNQHYRVDGQADREGNKWNYVLTDLKTGEKRTGPLPGIELHAHLYFFLSQDGERFAMLDASAGHHLANRFMIYNSNGKLISSLGINDILTKNEQTQVQQSVSHIWWLKHDPKSRSYGKYLPDENAVSLTTMSERDVVISLVDGKLIKIQTLDFNEMIRMFVIITALPLGCLFLYGLAMVCLPPFRWFSRDWEHEFTQKIQGKPEQRRSRQRLFGLLIMIASAVVLFEIASAIFGILS